MLSVTGVILEKVVALRIENYLEKISCLDHFSLDFVETEAQCTATKNSQNPERQEQSRKILRPIQSLLPKNGRNHREHRF